MNSEMDSGNVCTCALGDSDQPSWSLYSAYPVPSFLESLYQKSSNLFLQSEETDVN